MSANKLKVFFDGSCRVCAREMEYYRQRDQLHALEFIDITDTRFAARQHGRSLEQFMARLHVQESDGAFRTGIDAFAAIWKRLPGEHLGLLAAVVQLPGIHLLASLGYEGFARLRPWLPKQAGGCEDDSCGWGHNHPRF